MNHYFKNTDLEHEITKFSDTICGYNINFTTDSGVFSKDHVDHLTKIFLEVIIDEIDTEYVLDFGCGYGVIGLCVSKYHNCKVDMLDVNKRAVELSRINAKNNDVEVSVFESDMYENIDNEYTSILINPPIHAGKKICYNIYEESLKYLKEDGYLYIVLSKKHGAKSTIEYLNTLYKNVDIMYKKKAVYVIKAKK